MKKLYTEPNMTIDLFEDVVATDGINGRVPGGNSGLPTNGLIEEEEEY